MKHMILICRSLVAAFLLIIMLGIVMQKNKVFFGTNNEKGEITILLEGDGTEENPYLITSVQDLCLLRDAVNAGDAFNGVYFQQTCDLDLKDEVPWEPIGLYSSDNYFYGIYDGGTHRIFNMNCYSEQSETVVNAGLFGQLGGQVRNLGIESGSVKGDYVGSIASHAVGSGAVIINCYNRASVTGSGRAGGICDNFSGGIVVNCANYGEVTGNQTAQIVSYNAKNVINVYPMEDAISSTFQGTIYNYLAMDVTDVFDLLNSGIDYLEQENAFQNYGLKRWNS